MITHQIANAIYDILVDHAEASAREYDRNDFVRHATSGRMTEWRFQGNLGFGGKFKCSGGLWYVDCYQEDMDPYRKQTIEFTNRDLADLKARSERKTACGNPLCGVSSGIHEGLTFGSGELDDNGFWAHPCGPCARDYERRHADAGPCWPFENIEVKP